MKTQPDTSICPICGEPAVDGGPNFTEYNCGSVRTEKDGSMSITFLCEAISDRDKFKKQLDDIRSSLWAILGKP